MRPLVRCAALAVAGIALFVYVSAAQSRPGVELSESTEYYRISGETLQALLKQMREKSPTDESGRHWFAYTHWYIRWNYVYSRASSPCTVGSVNVTLQVKVTLPAWNAPRDVASTVQGGVG